MTVRHWLKTATQHLADHQIDTARLDALVLLGDMLERDKAWILSHDDELLSPAALEQLDAKIQRRFTHEPLAYIRGKASFFGRDFLVNSAVLVPRPESEAIIELLDKTLKNRAPSLAKEVIIADIGTGSGALAISAKLAFPTAEIYATDIDAGCLVVAQHNATALGAKVHFFQGDLLQPLIDAACKPNILLCNLPYVPDAHPINQAATHEPRFAIFGGTDGLDYYRLLFTQASIAPEPPRIILTEALPEQHQTLAKIATDHGYSLAENSDFIQCFSHTN